MQTFSPLRAWVTSHGNRSIGEFFRLEAAEFRRPLLLNKLNKNAKFPAYVDVDEKFSVTDKLSMINTLLQMENVTSYDFMRSHKGGRIHIHAFWFDIYTGDIHIFSRKENTFVVVNDETLPQLEVGQFIKTYYLHFTNWSVSPTQAELYEIIMQTHLTDSKQHGMKAGLLDSEVPSLRSLVTEARRNFSTNPCNHGCEHHHHQH